MVTSRTTTKTATGTATKKPAAKKALAEKPAAKKPAAKTGTAATTKKTTAKKAVKPLPAKSAAAKGKPDSKTAQKTNVTPEERYQMIAAAAYWRAERRNFTSGHALDDWIAAEAEIDARLKA